MAEPTSEELEKEAKPTNIGKRTFTFLTPHVIDQFNGKIGHRDPESGCLYWAGTCSETGYGVFWAKPFKHRPPVVYSAYRFAYELDKGPLNYGVSLDHTCHTYDIECPGGKRCRHRKCVEPDHLEVVTPSENSRRAAERTRLHKLWKQGLLRYDEDAPPFPLVTEVDLKQWDAPWSFGRWNIAQWGVDRSWFGSPDLTPPHPKGYEPYMACYWRSYLESY